MAELARTTVTPGPRDPPMELAERQQVWRGARRWTAAFVVAAFPFIFIIDEAVETALSPVLPGLAVLCLLIVALPPLLAEAGRRVTRHNTATVRVHRVEKFQQTGRTAFILALLWFAIWLSLGA